MRVYIVAASDAEGDAERRKRWGDYWFKDSLGHAMEALGHEWVHDIASAEVLVNLHGATVQRLPEWTYNVLWIIGHPDTVTREECDSYDAVFSESAEFARHIQNEWGIACQHLPGASGFVPMDLPKRHRRVFVGNARNGSRPCIDALKGDYSGLAVWGEGWEHLPEGVWKGPYYPHDKLNILYARAQEVLNDSHEDMDRWGFTNPREYDVRATRGEKVPTFRECAERIMARAHRVWGLDLGCGGNKRPILVGVDKVGGDGIEEADLEQGLPDGYREGLEVIVADNVLEHITNLIPLMNDCHDALLPYGRMHIRVPSATTTAAFQDPTHCRFFVPETFDYFNAGHSRWQAYGRSYGIEPWRVVYRRMDGPMIDVMLRPAGEDAP